MHHKATSPAASEWCSKFAENLSRFDDVFCINAVNNSMFPKGKFYVKGYRYNKSVPVKTIPYLSMPFIRKNMIIKGMKNAVDELIKQNKVTHLITYNTTSQNMALGQYLKNKGIFWINIYADADNDKQLISDADYHIYFSYNSYLNSKYENKINFEGGVYKPVEDFSESNKKIFLYTGKIRKENGVELMINAFKMLNDNDVRLIITGNGNYEGFLSSVSSDDRIEYKGLVRKEELESLYREATVLLNPRLSIYEENNNNFPSKLLEYLSYGKPIITTKTKGINPIYLDYMYILENENPLELSKLMNETKRIPMNEKTFLYNKIKHFSNDLYSWNNRINELWTNIKEIYDKKSC